METWQWIVVLAPLAVIQLGLMAVALVDLAKREEVRGGSKLAWALVIVLVNFLGPAVYLLWGREAGVGRPPD